MVGQFAKNVQTAIKEKKAGKFKSYLVKRLSFKYGIWSDVQIFNKFKKKYVKSVDLKIKLIYVICKKTKRNLGKPTGLQDQ